MADKPAPRGRAALVQSLKMLSLKTPGGAPEKSEEPPKPRGRAALLSKVKEMSMTCQAGREVEIKSEIVKHGDKGQVIAKEEQVIVKEEEAVEPSVCSFKGSSGEAVYMTANYIYLTLEKNKGIFEYELRFSPEIDSKQFRIKMLNSKLEQLGGVKMFDGGTVVYLPSQLSQHKMVMNAIHPVEGSEVVMTLTYKKTKRLRECIHFFNVLFKRVMVALQYSRVVRNYFDVNNPIMVPQHKLEVLPGYAVAVDEVEGGLMVCVDSQHKVLRTDTALELMMELKLTARDQFRDRVTSALIGATILTKYNNKTYTIHDICWDISPKDTFDTQSGGSISFIEYYQVHYGLKIQDPNQPMLLHIQKVHKNAVPGMEERKIMLVPELSYLTGLTEDMRKDFRIMKDVAQFTRITPQQRVEGLRRYTTNVKRNPQAQKILGDWGLTLEDATIDLNARILNPETIVFGNNKTHTNDAKADWTGALSRNKVIGTVDLTSWIIVHTEKDVRIAKELADGMLRLGNSIGMTITRPTLHSLPNDKTNTFVDKTRQIINDQLQMIVFVFSSARTDLYSAVKRICCLQAPIPIQCILSRTLMNQKKVRTVTLKVTLQILCKIGGSPWALQIPVKKWMVIGIDINHSGPSSTKPSVLGFVASLNDSFTKWYSLSHIQKNEVSSHLKMCFVKSVEKYFNLYGYFPDKVIVFRDGLGEGQLEQCRLFEIPQFEEVIKQFKMNTQITFVVVQKRINTRLFLKQGSTFINPCPGSIVDTQITKKYLFDYFLVPQHVTQGTVTPTHYVVISNNANLKPDHLQRLSFKLCHLYYNWSGTIRVPAPCQYAHKLAYLVGQYIGKEPMEQLNDKLYYL